MKRRFLLLLMSALCVPLFAWDVIITREGGKIEGKIEEVSEKLIKYHKASNPDGPLFVIELKEIATVIYENGDVQAFEEKLVSNENNSKQTLPHTNRSTYTGDMAMLNVAIPPHAMFSGLVIYFDVRYKDDDSKSFKVGPFGNGTYATMMIPVGEIDLWWFGVKANTIFSGYEDMKPSFGKMQVLYDKKFDDRIEKGESVFIGANSFLGVCFLNEKKFEKDKRKCTQANVQIVYKQP